MNDRYSVDQSSLDDDVEHIVDTQGLSYADAMRKITGEPATSNAESPTVPHYALPGVAIRYPKSGHVRDFDSIPDSERLSGIVPPQTPEEWEALEKELPYLQVEHDAHVLRRIQDEYLRENDPITYREARAKVYTYYKDKLEAEAILEIFEEYFGDGVYRASAKPIIVE